MVLIHRRCYCCHYMISLSFCGQIFWEGPSGQFWLSISSGCNQLVAEAGTVKQLGVAWASCPVSQGFSSWLLWASSHRGGLRAIEILAWWLRTPDASFSKRDRSSFVASDLDLGVMPVSFLPHAISYEQLTSPPRSEERAHEPHFLMGGVLGF